MLRRLGEILIMDLEIYRARMRMAHFTLTRSVSEDVCCILAYASG